MELWYLYILLGIVAGVVSVTLGIGSGIIMVPALTLLFALVPESARGVALCVMVPMAMMGAARHVLDKDIQIDLTIVLLVAVGAIAGDAGKGAAIGAASGGLLGGMKRRDQVAQEQQAQEQWAQQQAAKRESYMRAYGACLEGKNYTVK